MEKRKGRQAVVFEAKIRHYGFTQPRFPFFFLDLFHSLHISYFSATVRMSKRPHRLGYDNSVWLRAILTFTRNLLHYADLRDLLHNITVVMS